MGLDVVDAVPMDLDGMELGSIGRALIIAESPKQGLTIVDLTQLDQMELSPMKLDAVYTDPTKVLMRVVRWMVTPMMCRLGRCILETANV